MIVLGFGGLDVEDEKALAYQGFNVGSGYPRKRGENYIYEGLIPRLLKQERHYFDATNVVQFFRAKSTLKHEIPQELRKLDSGIFTGNKIVIDPTMAMRLLDSSDDPHCMLWVFRYYDLDERAFPLYGKALVRLIDFIRALIRLKEPDGQGDRLRGYLPDRARPGARGRPPGTPGTARGRGGSRACVTARSVEGTSFFPTLGEVV